jgi:hypothetical protein
MTTNPSLGKSLLATAFASLLALGCSSGPSGPAGGAVTGALDAHCKNGDGGQIAEAIGVCMPGGAGSADGGAGSGGNEYGETLFNAEGDDDDCKYHLAWTSSAVRKGADVTFNVTVTRLEDGMPAHDANLEAEVFLSDTHPAASPDEAPEAPADSGKYAVGPIKFDTAGRWTVRFHLYDECADAPDSPHSHVAFYVDVP